MTDEAARMREMAYLNVSKRIDELKRQMDNTPLAKVQTFDELRLRKMEAEYIVATCLDTRSLPLPPASDKTAEALRLALETLNLIVDLYDARSELYTMHDDMAADLANRARKALAALSALTRPDGGE